MDIVLVLPLLFWISIITLIIVFIVKKVKKSRAKLESRIEALEEQVQKDG